MDATLRNQLNLAQLYFLEHRETLLSMARRICAKGSINEWLSYEEEIINKVLKGLGRAVDDGAWRSWGMAQRKGYIFSALRNAWIDIKRRTREQTVDEPSFYENALRNESYLNTENGAIAGLFWTEVLNSCSTEEQELIKMHFAGFSYNEIAATFGESSDALRQRLSRLKKKIRRLYGDDRDSPPYDRSPTIANGSGRPHESQKQGELQ